ncbi:uncharacterized protein [Triticum aestivum]|uniref:uncharacterized protein n=1 Tax=Triticum aestivum TaxID=4565 RepID=UPI001D01619F|nr:uncharacterized protein LOC123163163 [Triticum aestivum]
MASRPCPRAFAICPKNEKMTPGICKLLFETPSGFAIFSFDMQYLHKDIEDTWHYFVGDYWHYCILTLHAFRKFEDKSSAINITTGELGGPLANLLFEYCLTDELILVGKPEYKSIIEEKLRLPCRCDEMVMEVMWGLQNLMPLLIPQEQSEFTKADRLPICKGLDMLLSRHGINNVKQELINEHILRMALKVYHADVRENEHSMFLRRRLYKDLKASGFDVKNWDLLKLVTALKSMVDPDGTRLTRRAEYNVFSPEELALMDSEAPKYEDLIERATISKIYNDIVAVRAYVVKVLLKLRHLVKKAEAALKTEDVLEKAATNGVNSMHQVDNTCLALDLVEVPNLSSIDEEQQCHITDADADGLEILPPSNSADADGVEILPPSKKCRRKDA